MRSHQRQMQAVAAVAAQYITGVALTAEFLRYACAALRDERNGYQYTAAIQWRRAAELFVLNTAPEEYCWRQWERIMRVPRKFAVPISDEPEVIEAAA
jgi:hypothetical protein